MLHAPCRAKQGRGGGGGGGGGAYSTLDKNLNLVYGRMDVCMDNLNAPCPLPGQARPRGGGGEGGGIKCFGT